MPKEPIVQGDALPTTLAIKNHSSSPQKLDSAILQICCAATKDLKAKTDSFETVSTATLDLPAELAAQGQAVSQWEFVLDKNCCISDKSQTLYFRYGSSAGMAAQLPLTVLPHPHIEGIVRILESFFQFVPKGQKTSKGWVEVKLKPAASPRFSMVNELKLGFRFEGEELVLRFNFNVKKFETEDSAVKIGKGKTEFETRLHPARYLLAGQHLNQEVIEAELEKALKEVATGLS
ncbi:MAG: hypothetical protein J0M12_04260 [Deltaproteobacteria bacterium]|nr:hypothetical protein [Deltaproteobacteria bacterium]